MITLTGAYGRDYKSKKAVIEDLKKNKDFIINDISNPYDGRPCSPLSDLKGKMVTFRYSKLTKAFTHKL